MTLTPEQIGRLLNEPIYSWDVSGLLAGIVDFLDFSENNISWQREREVRRAREEADSLEFEEADQHLLPRAREQMIESAELRFDIGISQSVRYAGLTAFVVAIEWCMRLFSARLAVPAPPKPKGVNESVHILHHLRSRVQQDMSAQLQQLKHSIVVRNCVVHAAGVVPGYRHATDVRQALAALDGFSASDAGLLRETIHIKRGAVDILARQALVWVPSLDRECSTNGTFHGTP